MKCWEVLLSYLAMLQQTDVAQSVDGKAIRRGQRGGIVEAEIVRDPDHSL